MKILICSSTKHEINILIEKFGFNEINEDFYKIYYNNNEISILISGIGMVNTTYNLMSQINKDRYDFIINAGICGSFSEKFKIGDVLNIVYEQFGDLGVDDNGVFKTFFDLNFFNQNKYPFQSGKLFNNTDFHNFVSFNNLQKVCSISVNKASGEQITINKLIEKFNPDIENMEGAAFFYVCLMGKIPFVEIRSVSNYIEPRNKKNWNIELAVSNLNKFLITFLKDLI